MSKLVQSFQDLDVYRGAFKLQQKLFAASKRWPDTEKFALTDQIRGSSRSIEANIAEAWAKRRYPAHFLSKLTDSDGELQETVHWLVLCNSNSFTHAAEQFLLSSSGGEGAGEEAFVN